MADLSQYNDTDIINILSSDAETELKKRGYVYGWYKKEDFVGAIYIMINPAFPNLVKIGYADDVQKRMKTLNSNSGLPDPFHCYALYKVKKRLEDLRLHQLIDSLDSSLRHSKNREFFEMNEEKAWSILSAIAQINGNEEQLIKNPFNDEYFVSSKQIDNINDNCCKSKKNRLTFAMLGIPVNSQLVYEFDNNIIVNTINDKSSVIYQGNVYTLSGLVKKLKGYGEWQGGNHFLYNGKKLTELREELNG